MVRIAIVVGFLCPLLAVAGAATIQKAPARRELLPTGPLDVTETVEMLKGVFGDPRTGAPFIEPDADGTGIVVRGTDSQIRDVKEAINALRATGSSTTKTGRILVIDLGKGSGPFLARELARLLKDLRKSPIQVTVRGSGKPEKLEPQTIAAGKDDRPGSTDKSIRISASGNRLLVASDDTNALKLVRALVKRHTSSPVSGNFEVIRLKKGCKALDAAEALHEAFTGQATASEVSPVEFFRQFQAPGAILPADPVKNRIQVTAYPPTNAILLRATPPDFRRARQLLAKALDSAELASKATVELDKASGKRVEKEKPEPRDEVKGNPREHRADSKEKADHKEKGDTGDVGKTKGPFAAGDIIKALKAKGYVRAPNVGIARLPVYKGGRIAGWDGILLYKYVHKKNGTSIELAHNEVSFLGATGPGPEYCLFSGPGVKDFKPYLAFLADFSPPLHEACKKSLAEYERTGKDVKTTVEQLRVIVDKRGIHVKSARYTW